MGSITQVNDIHSYPWPGSPKPSDTQAAMIGEFGGVGCFQAGHMWTPKGCHTYLQVPDAKNESDTCKPDWKYFRRSSRPVSRFHLVMLHVQTIYFFVCVVVVVVVRVRVCLFDLT
jgi:hypothetical protein